MLSLRTQQRSAIITHAVKINAAPSVTRQLPRFTIIGAGSAWGGRRKDEDRRGRQHAITRSTSGDDGQPQPSTSGSNRDENDIDQLKKKFFSSEGSSAPQEGPAPAMPADDEGSQPQQGGGDSSLTNLVTDLAEIADVVNPFSLGRQVRRAFDQATSSSSNSSAPATSSSSSSGSSKMQPSGPPPPETPLDTVNPLVLGRQARKAFDEVWTNLANLASPTKNAGSMSIFDDEIEAQRGDAENMQAAGTTVLVVGATGRVGRVLTRKLLLRGYKVKALVRRKDRGGGMGGADQDGGQGGPPSVDGVPAAVGIVFGDVGENRDCQEAVKGVHKVIYCASARSAFTGELLRVEETGVRNITKAFQDECIRQLEPSRAKWVSGVKPSKFTAKSKKEIADFSRKYHQARWDITFVGVSDQEAANQSERSREMAKYNQAIAEINEDDNLIFEGVLYQREAVAEVGATLASLMPKGEHRTADTEGIVMRLRGDGKQYACVLKTAGGHRYAARFPSRVGYLHVRMPWTAFRAEGPNQPPLNPVDIDYMGVRYEFRRSPLAARAAGRGAPPTVEEVEAMKKERQFQIEVDWIKALPGGVEPDVVLVSCAGTGADANADLAKVVEFKRRGEDILKISGLGYTIIRPGPIVSEPGGYKALVFDQGGRITESISAADVADICLRSLHEPAARNKTFDVCYEFQTEEGLEMYEMVAHVPTSGAGGDSYLKAAVSALAKNT